jgi:hypothetical protein
MFYTLPKDTIDKADLEHNADLVQTTLDAISMSAKGAEV